MTETAWSEEEAVPPKKRGIPTWLWFCGGGCLLAVVLAIVAFGLVYRFVSKGMDPELQKQALAKILPYDEWPPEMKPVFGMQMIGEQYSFEDLRGFQEQIQLHRGRDGVEGRKGLFESDPPKFPQNLGVMKFEDMKPGTVEVQGRDLRVIRMRVELAAIITRFMDKDSKKELPSMAFVDLTPQDLEGMLLLQITRRRGDEPITDDEIREILKPFHVGPKRGP
jgi:hypothetical protein